MTSDQTPAEPSGIDLARQALAEYKKCTWAIPGTTPPKQKRTVRGQRPGTKGDPVPLGRAIAGLTADFGSGLDGGSVMDRWNELCPQYAGKVLPVAFNTERGRLDLRPSNYAFASQLRLLGGQLAKQINDKLGKPVVKSIRVLAPGDTTTPADATALECREPLTAVNTRETAHPGYREALAANFENRPDRPPTDPDLLDAIERQDAALRAHRMPEDDVVHELESVDEAARRRARSDATSRAARAFKHGEQKKGPAVLFRAFDVA